ncbi:trypsin-like peptidase domain-containing protein [Mesorhizobium sp. CC13]|uniref:trypsin-like peptidase domain-containing protein n=1 Tax=Mesorhizobium sp. CC13 TaxID=3029194 RepID=UPI0032632863
MRLESALELQAIIFSTIFNFVELPVTEGVEPGLPGLFLDPYLLETKAARPKRATRKRAAEDIALGVSLADGDEAKLAVLVQSRNKLQSRVVEQIVESARGEAEVLYIGRQKPLWTTLRNDPIRLGASISPTTVEYSGTLGCFCRDEISGRDGILSNNHVLADVNNVPIGTTIMQPGARDRGRPATDVIAELLRFVPVQFGGIPNLVDCAVAALTDHGRAEDRRTLYDSSDEPRPAVTLQPGQPVEAVPGMTVFKTGRTTRHTRGRVRAVNVNNYLVDMGVGVARFDGQIAIEMDMSPARAFSRPGDSGSLIVDEEGRPVGLLFAGSASGGPGNVGITGANPISSVTSQLGVTLI